MAKRKIKKERKEKQEKKREETQRERQEKQLKWILIIMGIIVLIAVLFYLAIDSTKRFEYRGLKFEKILDGQIIYYKTLLEFTSPYDGSKIPFILKLRNDPRVLGKEIELDSRVILRKEARFSLSPEIANCSDTFIVIVDFSRTLTAFSIKISAGTNDEKFAKENNMSRITCKDAINKTVILMTEGEKNRIIKDSEFSDCYRIEINNCQIREGFERFLLGLVES